MAIAEHPLIYPEYALSILLALLVGALFPVMQDIRAPRHRRQYVLLQVITLAGALVGCKLAVLFGETGWPLAGPANIRTILFSGRSILGALLGGLLAAEIAKPVIGYPLPPNDRFAAVLPFTLAIGRVGCLLHGCCRGVAWNGWCAITYSDGIRRHPAPAYEMAFDLAVGAVFVWMVRKGDSHGMLFSIFLILYGVFRFFTEFLRETPKLFGSYSGYQILSAVVVVAGILSLMARFPRMAVGRATAEA